MVGPNISKNGSMRLIDTKPRARYEKMWESKGVFVLGILLFCVCALPGALAAGGTDTHAGSVPEDINDSETFTGLTGDWYGERSRLADNGIKIELDVIQFYQGVLDGGVDKSWKYGGTAEGNLHFDFHKLGLWPGAFVHARVQHQFGRFANDATGALFSANAQGMFPLPDYDGVTFTKVTFTQFLSQSMAVFLGKLDTSEADGTRFSGARGKDNFMNQNLVFNPVGLRGVPLSAMGGGFYFIWPDVFAEKPATLAFVILGADGTPNTAGWDGDFDNGTVYVSSFKLPTEFFGKDGSHTFAGVYTDKDYALLDEDDRLLLQRLFGLDVTLEEKGYTWAFMYNFDQYIFTEAEDETQGIGLFGRYGFAEDENNPFQSFYSIGLGGKGIIDGRDNDTFGIGYYYVELSDEFPKEISRFFDDPQGFEIFYNVEATPWAHITADFQILDTSDKTVDTSYIAGLRARIDF